MLFSKNASEEFRALKPKEKIIGKTFIEVFDNEVKKLGKVDFLAQGTLYPDVIESVPIGGNPAALIKSHHNVGWSS